MFTSLDAARQRRAQRPQSPSALRLAIEAPPPDARTATLNKLLRMTAVLLAVASAVLMAAAVLLP